ncbi:FecR domain-containing protein, partial [Chloroflexota bacterium]
MGIKFPEALDKCLVRISQGEAVEACLAEYPHLSEQLEPLLYMASSISAAPKASPSDEFRKMSRVRLIARLHEEPIRAKAAQSGQRTAEPNLLVLGWQRLMRAIIVPRKVVIPIALALLIALGGSLSLFGVLDFSPPSALVSNCTLSIVTGSIEIQTVGSNIWEKGIDGVTLEAGTRVRTSPDSYALLTFFEGSTAELEPNTEVEIKQLEYVEGGQTKIVLKQWLGRTYSRVVKMVDPGSRYEIQTPSAYALVRGTAFLTKVDEMGSTLVEVTEGLVTVGAQNEDVNVPAGYETEVGSGQTPSKPTPIGPQGPDGEGPQGPGGEGPQGPDGEGPQGPDGEGLP